MHKSKKRTFIIVTVIAIATIAVSLLFTKKPKSIQTQVETAFIKKGEINHTVTATGTIEPISTVEVGTQVSGTISKIYVDYNSFVKKGQLLAELDRTVLLSELKSQENNLESAKNEEAYQKKNYERMSSLYDKNKISESELEGAEYKYNNARYAVKRAQAQFETAKTNLSYATIYSPIDGVVLSKSVQEGQTVAASFNTPTLFTIAHDLTKMQVIADIDEADIGQVQVGQNVEFTVDAFPDDKFKGTVTQIRLEAQITSNVVTYNVVIEAPNPNLKLMPGLTASVTIYTLHLEDILLLPIKATNYTPDRSEFKKLSSKNKPHQKIDQPYVHSLQSDSSIEDTNETLKIVWLKSENTKKPVKVFVGESDGNYYEIKEGLKEGEEVIVSVSEISNKKINTKSEKSPFMPGPPGTKKNK